MVCIADCPPENQGVLVGNQDLDRQPLTFWPNLRARNLHHPPTDTLPALVANQKKMPQIDFIRLLPEQGIRRHRATVLKKYRATLPGELTPHPLVQFWTQKQPLCR